MCDVMVRMLARSLAGLHLFVTNLDILPVYSYSCYPLFSRLLYFSIYFPFFSSGRSGVWSIYTVKQQNPHQVKSQEIRSRTIAELGTEPQYRYTPSWDALAKRQDEAMAREKAIADTAAAEASTAATSSANGTDGSGPVVGSSSVDAMEVDGGSAPGEGVGSRDNILGILEGRGKRGAGGGQTTAEKAAEKAAAAKITQTKKKKRKFDKVGDDRIFYLYHCYVRFELVWFCLVWFGLKCWSGAEQRGVHGPCWVLVGP